MAELINRKTIFIVFVLIMGFCLFWLNEKSSQQNQQFLLDYYNFSQAAEMISRGELEQASDILNDLLANHQDNYLINYYYGLCLSEQGKYKEAAQYLLVAQKLRPALLGEQGYLLIYGKTLANLGDSDAAKYLRGSIKYGQDKQLIKSAESLLDEMNGKKQ